VYLALDTSMLWNTYCLVRVSLAIVAEPSARVEHPEHPVAVWRMTYTKRFWIRPLILLLRFTVVFTAIVDLPTRT